MSKKVVLISFVLLSIITISLCVVSFAEEISINNPIVVEFDQEYSGMITSDNTVQYYQFVIPSSGKVSISAIAEMNDIKYIIYDERKKELFSTGSSADSVTGIISTKEEKDLLQGTYFLAVSQAWSSTGNYSLTLSFEDAKETFPEAGEGVNNTVNSANQINLNEEYLGQISINDEKDFYKFSLSKDQTVNLFVSAEMKDLKVSIYDETVSELKSYSYSADSVTGEISSTENVDLSAGVYYLVFSQSWSATGKYSFEVSAPLESDTKNENNSNIIDKTSDGSSKKDQEGDKNNVSQRDESQDDSEVGVNDSVLKEYMYNYIPLFLVTIIVIILIVVIVKKVNKRKK